MAGVSTRLFQITAFHCVSLCQKKFLRAAYEQQILLQLNKNHAKKSAVEGIFTLCWDQIQ
jgi:hypothetical protein